MLSFHATYGQQVLGHFPLSRFGIGSYFGNGLVRNEGMASTGLAIPSPDNVNLLNPAMLPFNRNANLEFDLWYAHRELKVDDKYSQIGGSGPAQISVCLPVHKKATVAFGIRRYTNYEFLYARTDFLGDDSIRTRNSGSGGTSQAFLSFGVSLGKKLKIGLETGYVFGTLLDVNSFVPLPAIVNYTTVNTDIRKISTLTFKPGLFYQTELRKQKKTMLTFAGVADLGGKVGYKTFSTTQLEGISGSLDTLVYDKKSHMSRPGSYSFAVGMFHLLDWSLSAEVNYAVGKNVDYNETSITGINSYSYKLGGEYSIGTDKSTQYINIITWRAGLSYQNFPYTLNGENIKDKKVSIGASFPIVRKETKFTRPLISLAVAYGQRGLQNTYIGIDKYWVVTLGFTLNDTQWFTRYRVD